MSRTNRREFLKVGGALLGGIAVGSQVTAATRNGRFVAETKGKGAPNDLDVVHEMPGVKFVVVEGREKEVKKSKAVRDYAPDVEVELDAPDVNSNVPSFDASDYEGQPGDFLQWDKEDLNVPEAHESTEGEGTRVSVIDSGVLETHPDLAGPLNVDLSRNFTDDGGDHNPVGDDDHGTHVAGIVAADNGGGIGVNGTAPKTDLVDCRVFSGPTASFADILAAVVYSANIGADVANLSLGAYPIPRDEGQFGQFYGKVLNRTMTYANKEGTLLVIAAGNDSADLQHDKNLISLPNEGAQAVSVAATGPIGYGWEESPYAEAEPPESPAFYTNYGTNAITLGAPGGDASLAAIAEDNDDDGDGEPDPGGPEDPLWYYDLVFNAVFSVDDDGNQIPGYGWKAGTSMAAPNVAGAAALVKSANPNYNANQVEAALKRAADVPDDYDRTYYGSGYLNIVDAL
jgi:subtilisin family serine protease